MKELLFVVITIGQPLASLPLPPGSELPLPPETVVSYADAYALAMKQGSRLAVFIGVPAREIKGVVSIRVEPIGRWRDLPANSLAVYGPVAGKATDELHCLGHVKTTATDEDIRNGGRKAVQPVSADPFPRIQSAVACVT